MAIITVSDVPQFIVDSVDAATLTLLVDGLNARAARVAPCLAATPTADQVAEAKLVLVGTLTRWAQVSANGGAFTQETYGPFSVSTDTRNGSSGYGLRPDEIEALQDICRAADSSHGGRAFEVDTIPPMPGDGYWSDSTTWVPLP